MPLSHHIRRQHPAGGLQRGDGRVDAQLHDLARKHRGSVQMGEGGSRGGIRQVVRRHVDRLNRGDRAVFRGYDTLLQHAHLRRQGRLIAHGGGHAPQQGRHLRARLGKPEHVVYEQQHILPGRLAEILRDGKARQGHAKTRAGRFVHLAEHQRRFIDDAGILHLVPQIVALAGAFPHAGEHGIPLVLVGNVADKLHDQHRLSHARAAEQADLAAAGVGGHQIHDLDARLQDLVGGHDVRKIRGLVVDGPALVGFDGAGTVDGIAGHIDHAAQHPLAHGHGDGRAGIHRLHPAGHAVRRAHGNAAHRAVAQLLQAFQHMGPAADGDLQRMENIRNTAVLRELDVHHRSADAGDGADIASSHSHSNSLLKADVFSPVGELEGAGPSSNQICPGAAGAPQRG